MFHLTMYHGNKHTLLIGEAFISIDNPFDGTIAFEIGWKKYICKEKYVNTFLGIERYHKYDAPPIMHTSRPIISAASDTNGIIALVYTQAK